jgi:flagellar basal-body rod protein FlgG
MAALPFATRVDDATASVDVAEPANARVLVQADLRPGTLRATGQKLDLALSGSGWFEVRTAQGTAYTRQGNFRLDAQGRIVTQAGDAVIGLGGEIQLAGDAPVIDAQGRVFDTAADVAVPLAGRTPVGQLKLVQFEGSGPLRRLEGGLVLPAGEPVLAPEGSAEIRQGFLENANVSQVREMVELLQTLRHMESLQKVALGYDEMLGTTIRRLGEGA